MTTETQIAELTAAVETARTALRATYAKHPASVSKRAQLAIAKARHARAVAQLALATATECERANWWAIEVRETAALIAHFAR